MEDAVVTAPPELQEGYYVENVEVMLRTVAERYEDLLLDDERQFIETFQDLSQDAQRLWVRLISRKGPLFRRDLLRYPEIGDLDGAVDELVAAMFLDRGEKADAVQILTLLRKNELVDLTQEDDVACDAAPRSMRRGDVLTRLTEIDDPRWLDGLRTRYGVLQPLRHEELTIVRLLFFGNLYQDWTEFVLRDLGVVRYEPYRLDRELRLFPIRDALDHALELRTRDAFASECLAADDLDAAVEAAEEVLGRSWHVSTKRFVDRLCNRVGRALERAELYDDALRLYAEAEAPPSRERRARVLDRLDRGDEALALCAQIAEDPRDETELEFAPRFAHQIRRKRGEVPPWRRPRRPVQEIAVYRREDATVETLALEFFAAEAREGFFSENWLWRSLFGLTFWDVIFAPVAGAFQHPFQSGPLDLHSPDFRRNRRDAVRASLDALRDESRPGPRLLARWDEKQNTASSLVSWHPDARRRLAFALDFLTGKILAHVFERFSRDPRRYRRGFPDLFVLRPEAPGFELLEVKAPGDQLRPEQGGWIDHFNAGGVPASILKVRWEDE